ncbi:HERV-H LTR-associating protein 2 [Hoplias malabaricus]|uniref:HERV-H LTR-associating protein 2 n=1 Tax=Hoplias malabaricus TaxID=27720 RepID=UPI0034621796
MQLLDFLTQSVSYTFFGICPLFWILPLVQSKTPDVHITCIYSEDCILPCSFPSTDEKVFIQWYQQGKLIYSFPEDDDEDEDEDEPEDSNMSLFSDEISNGNASLLLKDSSVKSRGQYKCMVNTTKSVEECLVIVKVEAPINEISIEVSSSGQVQCSSHSVYPSPVLIWSTQPRVSHLKPVTRISPDFAGLYNVESTLKKLNRSGPFTYICTINPKYSSQPWKASLLQTEMVGTEGQDLVIPCIAPKNLKNFNLTWTFTKTSKSKDILTYSSQTDKVINHWDDHADMKQHKVRSGDGSLYMDDTEGLKHSGEYTCTFSGPKFKYIVQTSVSFSASRSAAQTGSSESKLWILAVVVAILALLCVLYFMYRKYRGKTKKNSGQDTEMQAVHKDKMTDELPTEDKPLNK